jgi:hypothetical protein
MTWLIKIEVEDEDARDDVAGILPLYHKKIIDIEFEELEEDDV